MRNLPLTPSMRGTVLRMMVAVLIAGSVLGCKSVKKVTSEALNIEAVTSETLATSDFARSFELEVYADTELKGFVPILNPSIAEGDTIRVPTESGGVTQELIITSKGISHVTKTKPVARSKLTEQGFDKLSLTSAKELLEKTETRIVAKQHTWRFPWLLLVIVAVAVGLTIYTYDKQWLNPFNLIRWILNKIRGSRS